MENSLKHVIKITNVKAYKFVQWDLDQYRNKVASNQENIFSMTNTLGGGVYRMYDENNEIIYVGKSNNVHRRFLQHIGKRTNSAYFIDQVRKIEYYRDDSPVMQTLLEGIFIALHMPKYNDEVKDLNKLEENN